jgi:hypothetical protein
MIPKLLPFSHESNMEAGSPLAILRDHVNDVANSVGNLTYFVGAIKESRNSHTNKMTDPSSRYFNSGYDEFMAHKARQTAGMAAVAKQEVAFVPVAPATENILDGKDAFDAHAFDLIAEAQRIADEAYDTAALPAQAPDLAQTVITSPDEQEVELQTMVMTEQEADIARLSALANGAAAPKDVAYGHLAETAQRY